MSQILAVMVRLVTALGFEVECLVAFYSTVETNQRIKKSALKRLMDRWKAPLVLMALIKPFLRIAEM